MRYTVAQAAAALGCSVRTVRRRIAAGELPSASERRGAADVTVVDASDLAAFAEARGQRVALPQGTEGNEGQEAAQGGDTEGHCFGDAAGQAVTEEEQSGGNGGAQEAGEGTTVGQGGGTEGQVPSGASGQGVAGTEQALIRRVRELEAELEWFRRHCDALTRALPPGPGEPAAVPGVDRRPWWRRMFRGREEAQDG